MKITPGPWKAYKDGGYWNVSGADDEVVGIEGLHSWEDAERDKGNAHLIAASLDLLEAAKAVVERWDTPLWKDVPATAEYIGMLRRAIEKACTESSGLEESESSDENDL